MQKAIVVRKVEEKRGRECPKDEMDGVNYNSNEKTLFWRDSVYVITKNQHQLDCMTDDK